MPTPRNDSNAGPLLSWDIFMSSYQRLMQKAEDLQAIKKLAAAAGWHQQPDFERELIKNDSVIVVTDVDRNIIFSSNNIIEMTGFAPNEIIGKKPTMFQGKNTERQKLKHISAMIRSQQAFEVTVVNYKKNGEPYDCHIRAFPIFDAQKKLLNFIAFEKAA